MVGLLHLQDAKAFELLHPNVPMSELAGCAAPAALAPKLCRLRSYVRSVQKAICHPPSVIHQAYLRRGVCTMRMLDGVHAQGPPPTRNTDLRRWPRPRRREEASNATLENTQTYY